LGSDITTTEWKLVSQYNQLVYEAWQLDALMNGLDHRTKHYKLLNDDYQQILGQIHLLDHILAVPTDLQFRLWNASQSLAILLAARSYNAYTEKPRGTQHNSA
jgi:hypothetical protein